MIIYDDLVDDDGNLKPRSSLDAEILAEVAYYDQLGPYEASKHILLTSVATEKVLSKRQNKKENLQGIAAAMKLYLGMTGHEQKMFSDVSLELPLDFDAALDQLQLARQSAKVGTPQFKDILDLLKTKADKKLLPVFLENHARIMKEKTSFERKDEYEIVKGDDNAVH